MNNALISIKSGAIAVAHILIRIVSLEKKKRLYRGYIKSMSSLYIIYNYYINIITNTIPLNSNIRATLNHISFALFHLVLLLLEPGNGIQ